MEFAAAGIAAMLAIEAVSIAVRAPARFRWKDAAAGAALGILTLLALSSPVIVDWLRISARMTTPILRRISQAAGGLAASAWRLDRALTRARRLGGAALLWTRSADNGACLRADAGQRGDRRGALPAHPVALRPSSLPHRACDRRSCRRITVLVFASRPLRGACGSGCARRDHPLAACRNAQSLGRSRRSAGLPRAPRADLDELARLKDCGRSAGAPDARVCGLGSSYTFSGQLIGEMSAIAPGAGDGSQAEAANQDAGHRCGRRPAHGGLEGMRHRHRRRSDPDPPRSPRPADGRRAVARDADGAGIGAKFHRTGEALPSGERRERGRIRASGSLDDAEHRSAPDALARAARGVDEAGPRP